jgi:hypothetical protein
MSEAEFRPTRAKLLRQNREARRRAREVAALTPERATLRALLMCAASCQGGHSDAGGAAADVLGIPFPITMENLTRAARRHGFVPQHLFPWLYRMRRKWLAQVRADAAEAARESRCRDAS